MDKASCKILIADDDRYIRSDIADLLAPDGYQLSFSETARQTWEAVESERPHLVLLDINFPDARDLKLLENIRKLQPAPEVIIVTSQTDNIERIVAAIKIGAFDYVGKPFNNDELRNRIGKALEIQALKASQQHLLSELEQSSGLARLIGTSGAMQKVRETIGKLADPAGCVLITGESGTGKELAARALHYMSQRRA